MQIARSEVSIHTLPYEILKLIFSFLPYRDIKRLMESSFYWSNIIRPYLKEEQARGAVIEQIAAGRFHTIFLTRNNSVFVRGQNNFGQLGLNSSMQIATDAILAEKLSSMDIVYIAASARSSYFLTRKGNVWVCGVNGSGQLGVGAGKTLRELTLIKDFANIKSIIANVDDSVFFINMARDIFACGSNSEGKLGLGIDVARVTHPTKLPSFSKEAIRNIFAGEKATFFVTEDEKVYACGRGVCGQLGQGDIKSSNVPLLIASLPPIDMVAPSQEITFFLTKNRQVYACGHSEGDFWRSEKCNRYPSQKLMPQLIQGLFGIIEIAANPYNGDLVCLTSAGTIIGLGKNAAGYFGSKKWLKDKFTAIPDVSNVARITVGCASSFFFKHDGTILGCGKNDASQLSRENKKKCDFISLSSLLEQANSIALSPKRPYADHQSGKGRARKKQKFIGEPATELVKEKMTEARFFA